jgi:hypothetical protein
MTAGPAHDSSSRAPCLQSGRSRVFIRRCGSERRPPRSAPAPLPHQRGLLPPARHRPGTSSPIAGLLPPPALTTMIAPPGRPGIDMTGANPALSVPTTRHFQRRGRHDEFTGHGLRTREGTSSTLTIWCDRGLSKYGRRRPGKLISVEEIEARLRQLLSRVRRLGAAEARSPVAAADTGECSPCPQARPGDD